MREGSCTACKKVSNFLVPGDGGELVCPACDWKQELESEREINEQYKKEVGAR